MKKLFLILTLIGTVCFLFAEGLTRLDMGYPSWAQYFTYDGTTVTLSKPYTIGGNLTLQNGEYISNTYDGFIDFFCGTTNSVQVSASSMTVNVDMQMNGTITGRTFISSTGNYMQCQGTSKLYFGSGNDAIQGGEVNGTVEIYTNNSATAEKVQITNSSMTVNVPFVLKSTTTAGIAGTTPKSINDMFVRSTGGGIFIATGTAIGQYGWIPVQNLPAP
jgi:hypothetical protein